MYASKILADSTNSSGHRLTTFQVTFPRFILAEVNTHRMLSRNSASSRAIPIEKSIQAIEEDMFVPAAFGMNQRGMQADTPLIGESAEYAALTWRSAGHAAIDHAISLAKTGVHKAWGNRVLEPYKWHTAILSGTDWSNFFALRTDANAQPEFRRIAEMMRDAYQDSEPYELSSGEWHLPLVEHDEMLDEALSYADPFTDWGLWKKVSVGRCARVSYLTHDGKRDLDADVALYERLRTNGHLSPFEHVARPFTPSEWDVIRNTQDYLHDPDGFPPGDERAALTDRLRKQLEYCGNFRGWSQVRYGIANQHDFSLQVAS